MARTRALLVGVLIVLTACSVGVSPDPLPTSPSAITGPPRHVLTRLDAASALQAEGSPRGFRVTLNCRGRHRAGCLREGTGKARWFVGTVATGATLPEGSGLRERVTTIVMAWPSRAQARRHVARVVRQLERYRGGYYVPSKKAGPHRDTPGEGGMGEVQRVGFEGWRGTGVRRIYVHYFDDDETSATLYGGRFVMRRGPYVADVEWVARGPVTDRRLSHLPARLIRGLP